MLGHSQRVAHTFLLSYLFNYKFLVCKPRSNSFVDLGFHILLISKVFFDYRIHSSVVEDLGYFVSLIGLWSFPTVTWTWITWGRCRRCTASGFEALFDLLVFACFSFLYAFVILRTCGRIITVRKWKSRILIKYAIDWLGESLRIILDLYNFFVVLNNFLYYIFTLLGPLPSLWIECHS